MTGPELASTLIDALNEFAGKKDLSDAYDLATAIIEEMSQDLSSSRVTELLIKYQELIAENRPPEEGEGERTESLILDLPPVPEAGEISKIVKRLLG